jgi:uncharacterized membrane protein
MDLAKVRLKTGYFFLGLFAIFIGLYPLRFIGLPYEESLLGSKSDTLLKSSIYLSAFYTHVFLGGLALLTGFSQFYKTLRKKRLRLHRALGKIYVIAVLLSGLAGLGIAFFATGGIIPSLGFAGLTLFWLYTTSNAYTSIKKMDINGHQRWMIRSYALCFAAVTLRLYLPLFIGPMNIEFIPAYKIIAWLCWVPNIIFAEVFIVRKLR